MWRERAGCEPAPQRHCSAQGGQGRALGPRGTAGGGRGQHRTEGLRPSQGTAVRPLGPGVPPFGAGRVGGEQEPRCEGRPWSRSVGDRPCCPASGCDPGRGGHGLPGRRHTETMAACPSPGQTLQAPRAHAIRPASGHQRVPVGVRPAADQDRSDGRPAGVDLPRGLGVVALGLRPRTLAARDRASLRV